MKQVTHGCHMTIAKGSHTTKRRTRRGTSALVLTCAVAGALLTAGPASAASRGFRLHNSSSHALHLEAVKPVPTFVCPTPGTCVPTHYPMDFEGRPANGSVLQSGREHVWELKYGFSLIGGVQYAANIWYRIAGNGGTVEYTIQVYSTSNESSCRVTPASAGRCTAAGTKLTFHNH
jgi:hypothetical protein